MSKKSKKINEIDEIFYHIKKIKSERNTSYAHENTNKIAENHPIQNIEKNEIQKDGDIIKEPVYNKEETISQIHTENVNETKGEIIINKSEEIEKTVISDELSPNLEINDEKSLDVEESVSSIMKPTPERWGDDSTGICDLCKREILFEKNLSGLVVGNKFFACEECCKTFSKEELVNWTKSRMIKPYNVRSIGLWATQEKNKAKSVKYRK
jgi:hypothetical protein